MTTTKTNNAKTNANQVVFTSTTSVACFLLLMLSMTAVCAGYWIARTDDALHPSMLFEALGWWIILQKYYSVVMGLCVQEPVDEFADIVEEISKPSDDLCVDHIEVAGEEVVSESDKVCHGLACNSVPRPKRYAAIVVQTCKNRFGTPDDNKANRLAVRKFALDIMSSHRVRPTHINQLIDLCVSMVFVPNDMEQAALALRDSLSYAGRRHAGDASGLARDMMRVLTGKSGKHV